MKAPLWIRSEIRGVPERVKDRLNSFHFLHQSVGDLCVSQCDETTTETPLNSFSRALPLGSDLVSEKLFQRQENNQRDGTRACVWQALYHLPDDWPVRMIGCLSWLSTDDPASPFACEWENQIPVEAKGGGGGVH